MKAFIIYMIVGYLVSGYFIYYYHYTSRKKEPLEYIKKHDSILALIGPFIWPLQIAYHFYLKFKN